MKRIQRRRGIALPEGAVYVGRPTRWGNPYRIGAPVTDHVLDGWHWWDDPYAEPIKGATLTHFSRRAAVIAYEVWLKQQLKADHQFLEPLRGKVLACWCPVELGVWCHATVILEWLEEHPKSVVESERAVFGLHRQDVDAAESAPAWPSLGSIESSRAARFKRWVKGALG